MSKLDQMRRGMEQLINEDKDIGEITRSAKTDNGRGQLVPTGETLPPHKLICRVGYQSGGVWAAKPWEGGLTIDTSPYVLARYDADIEKDDALVWRGKKYTVGVVSRPQSFGGPTCTQAPLTEVK
jgi:hypothetical protein